VIVDDMIGKSSLLTPTSYEVRGVTNLEKGGVWMT